MNKALEKDKAHMGKRYIEGNFANFTLILKKLGHTSGAFKGLSSKPSGDCIVVPNFCFLS